MKRNSECVITRIDATNVRQLPCVCESVLLYKPELLLLLLLACMKIVHKLHLPPKRNSRVLHILSSLLLLLLLLLMMRLMLVLH